MESRDGLNNGRMASRDLSVIPDFQPVVGVGHKFRLIVAGA
jgi:hypothetical protein